MTRYSVENLIEEALGALSGHTLDQPQVTWLTSNGIDASETSVDVEDGGQVSRGIAEIGEELVFVSKSASDLLTLAPFGRGYQGTPATSWPVNTMVTTAPRFPRYRIREAINDVIRASWPMLFGVGETELTADPVQHTYQLPVDVEDVLTVKQQVTGPSQFEHTFRGYGFNPQNHTLDLNEGFDVTHPLKVTYSKKPTALGAVAEFTDSGLAETAWPAIKYGVMHRLIAPQEAGTTGLNAVKAAEAKRQRNVSAVDLSRQYYQIHLQFLNEERARLLEEHEITNNEEYF